MRHGARPAVGCRHPGAAPTVSVEVVIEPGSTTTSSASPSNRSSGGRADARGATLEGDVVSGWLADWQPEDAALQAARLRAAEA